MMRFRRIAFGVFAFMIVSAGFAIAAPEVDVKNPQPGKPIEFDSKNSLAWNQRIRIKPDRTTETLPGIQLNYTLNGTKRTWSISGEKYPVGSQIIDIRYFSPCAAWIITRLNKEFGGAALLDLQNQKVMKGYSINGPYSISPDHRFIAYTYPIGAVPQDKAVFVNNVMIYPSVRMGANRTDDPRRYKEPNALGAKKSDQPAGFIHHIEWDWFDDSVSLFFEEIGRDQIRKAINGNTCGRFFYFGASGFDGAFKENKFDLTKVVTSQSEYEPETARFHWMRAIYNGEHGEEAFQRDTNHLSYQAQINSIGRAELMDPANLKSRDNNLLAVHSKQYYTWTWVLFPKAEFYSFKLGGTKTDVIKIFGIPDYDDYGVAKKKKVRVLLYRTTGGHRTYAWNFLYDAHGLIIRKYIEEETS